jgi:hypothetical protein
VAEVSAAQDAEWCTTMSISSLLTHCAGCESALIQMDTLEADAADKAIVVRLCPECGHTDALELPLSVAELLEQRSIELCEALLELADRLELADELWIYETGPSR